MASRDVDFFEEPKMVFTNTILIPRLSEVENIIYNSKQPSRAIRPMRGIIDSLNEVDQKRLFELRRRLVGWEKTARVTQFELEEAFRELSAYLHKTYLKGFFVPITKKDFEVLEKEASE